MFVHTRQSSKWKRKLLIGITEDNRNSMSSSCGGEDSKISTC